MVLKEKQMKILVTGGTGMIGSAFNNVKTDHELVLYGSNQYDLRDPQQVSDMLYHNPVDGVIHLAARVGGVKGNTDYVADFFHDNIMINTNLLSACHEHGVTKVVSVLSTCVYPDVVTYPLTEDQIHKGSPHQSNFGYAYAKRMLDIHSKALRSQYGREYVCAIPNNLYGPNDNFDLDNGHVLPAIIRKVWEAKQTGCAPTFWSDGSALREFTYSSDFAKILIWMVENYSKEEPLNIGNPREVSIASVVDMVCKSLEYDGPVSWDKSKPAGQFRKPSSNKNFLNLYGDFDYLSLGEGLDLTIKWFLDNYPNIRGI
jgi:GDP-L-fucose synthase